MSRPFRSPGLFAASIFLAGIALYALASAPQAKTGRGTPFAAADAEATPLARMPVVVGGRRKTPRSTPTQPPDRTGTPGPSPTQTPSDVHSTPTPVATGPPTPAPTEAPVIVIRLRAVDWQWDFYGVPGSPDGGPYATLRLGQTYELHVFNGGIVDTPPHRFSGNSALGISGFGPLDADGPEYVVTFQPTVVGAFSFLCTESTCGVGHDDMQGLITVLP